MKLIVNKSALAFVLALLLVATLIAGCATPPPIQDGDVVPAPLGEARPAICGTTLLTDGSLRAGLELAKPGGKGDRSAALGVRLLDRPAAYESDRRGTVELVDLKTCEVLAEESFALESDAAGAFSAINLESLPTLPDDRDSFYRIQVAGFAVATPAFAQAWAEQKLKCPGDLVLEDFQAPSHFGSEHSYEIMTDTPTELCIELEANGFWVVRQFFVDEQRLLPFSEDWTDGTAYRVEYPARSRDHEVVVEMAKGGFDLRVYATGASEIRDTPGSIDCGGRLTGFQNPFLGTYAPVIRREGVQVNCTAYFRASRQHTVAFKFGWLPVKVSGFVQVPVEATGTTDAEGVFSMTISESAMRAAGVSSSDLLVSIQTDCVGDLACGVDRRGAATNNPAAAGRLNISKVADLAFNGLVARLVTIADAPDIAGQLRNEYPVIVHEAFDPLREDGTDAMFWALGGQPFDYRRPGSESIVGNACDGVVRGRCYNIQNQLFPQEVDPECVWFNGCSSTSQGSGDKFRCEATNALLPILQGGYDVWLVDQVIEDASLLDVARSSPGMYQMIYDYQNIEPPDEDYERRLAVIGLSAGGVASRAGLRMWEKYEDSGGGNDLDPTPALVEGSTVGPDVVSMFMSYDSPHLGALVAPSFQALVKDNTNPTRRNFAELVDSQMAAELLQTFIDAHVDTSCLKNGKPDSCDITANDFADFEDPIRRTVFELFATDILGTPNPIHEYGRDGLPRGMKRIAVSNGSLTEVPLLNDDRVMRLELRTWLPFGWKDETLTLRDPNLVRGSGLPTYCRAKELEDTDNWQYDFKAEVLMKPDGVDPRKTYPTFIPTESALFLKNDPRDPTSALPELSARWTDAMWETHNSSHFQLTDNQCKFIMYHLEDSLMGDGDGYADCDIRPERSCLGGGMNPGNLITMLQGPNQCDCNDSRADINPGMDEIVGDFIDNDCDGEIDNELSLPIEGQQFDASVSAARTLID